MPNPGATGKYYWSPPALNASATEPVELITPEGTLTGVTVRTLINAWGGYQDAKRHEIQDRILAHFNREAA